MRMIRRSCTCSYIQSFIHLLSHTVTTFFFKMDIFICFRDPYWGANTTFHRATASSGSSGTNWPLWAGRGRITCYTNLEFSARSNPRAFAWMERWVIRVIFIFFMHASKCVQFLSIVLAPHCRHSIRATAFAMV